MPYTDPHIVGDGPFSMTCIRCTPSVTVWGDTKTEVKKAWADHLAAVHPA